MKQGILLQLILITNGAYFDYSVVSHFFDKNHVEMYGYFSEGTHNLLVTEDGFETVSYLNVECPIIDYYGMGNVSHSKYTSDTYGCILTGMTLMKGSTAPMAWTRFSTLPLKTDSFTSRR